MSRCSGCFRVVSAAFLFALALACVAAEDPDFTAGAKKMAARIDAILRAQNPMRNTFRNVERAEILREAAAKAEKEAPNSFAHVSAESQLAVELLRSGEMEESLKAVQGVEKIYEAVPSFAAGPN